MLRSSKTWDAEDTLDEETEMDAAKELEALAAFASAEIVLLEDTALLSACRLTAPKTGITNMVAAKVPVISNLMLLFLLNK